MSRIYDTSNTFTPCPHCGSTPRLVIKDGQRRKVYPCGHRPGCGCKKAVRS